MLRERKAVTMYSLYEYNQAGHMKVVREEGFEDGFEDGQNTERFNLNSLYTWLFDQDRAADVQRAVKDPEYLKMLQNEYAAYKKQKNNNLFTGCN